MAVHVGLPGGEDRRAREEACARHVVGRHDPLDVDACVAQVALERGDAVEEAGHLDHEAAPALLDDEHLIVDGVGRAICVQPDLAEVVDIHPACGQLDAREVVLVHVVPPAVCGVFRRAFPCTEEDTGYSFNW